MTAPPSLPPAHELRDADAVLNATSTLFEPSPPLTKHLVPALASALPYKSYDSLISACDRITSTWPEDLRAQFIAAHPRIGEVSNLSALSAQEQASKRTPPEVLARLEVRSPDDKPRHYVHCGLFQELNGQYEHNFPGLRFITFVAGRSREQVATDLAAFLKDHDGVYPQGSSCWKAELDRAVSDIWAIARHRCKGMGLE